MIKKTTPLLLLFTCLMLTTAQPFSINTLLHKTQTLWESVRNTMYYWWHQTPPQIQELEKSAGQREEEFTRAYKAQGIPASLAIIAGTIDRIEEDIKMLTKESAGASGAEVKTFKKSIAEREDESRALLKSNNATLEEYTEKSMRKKDAPLFKFVNILRTRAFLFERSA